MVRRSQTHEVVHDMRQPVAVIAALVAVAEVRDDLPPGVRLCLEQIKGQVTNLRELCHRVLDGSEACQDVAVDQLVTDVVRDAELAHGRHIELVTSQVTALGDEVSLRRAVWNLLENACRAAAAQWVRVVVGQAGGEVRVEVSDGGPGFTNGPPGTSSLGLAIVESVVRRHGGRVEVDATTRVGAQVTMVLPASGPGVAHTRVQSAAAAVGTDMATESSEKGEWCPAS